MDDAHREISDKMDKELNRYIGQYASLFILNEEIDLMLNNDALKSQTVETKTVVAWLTRLREVVQDGMQKSAPK